jgi:hypothetical protein
LLRQSRATCLGDSCFNFCQFAVIVLTIDSLGVNPERHIFWAVFWGKSAFSLRAPRKTVGVPTGVFILRKKKALK